MRVIITAVFLAVFANIAAAQTLPQVTEIHGTLGAAPAGGATGNLSTTIRRTGTASTVGNCSSVTPPSPLNFPSSVPVVYNVHYLKNPSIFPICVPVKLVVTAAAALTELHIAAFSGQFNPADITNPALFRGDPGFSVRVGTNDGYFNVLVPGNSSVPLVVYSTAGSFPSGTTYRILFNVRRIFYSGAPVPIPDDNQVGALAALAVSGVGKYSSFNLLFPEGPGGCDATIGNTNAAIEHSWLGDLIVRLRSPDNTIDLVMDRIGRTTTGLGNGGNNVCATTFSSVVGDELVEGFASEPLRGEFLPIDSFNSSNPRNANGTWILNVSDNFGGDTGTIRRFGLEFTSIPRPRAPYDYDGDNRTDRSIFRPSAGEWWYQKSSNGGNAALQFGTASDRIVPGDYTGDGIADIAFWRPGTGEWFILRSEDSSFLSFPFGTAGDIPVSADFDGDTFTDIAVFRPSNNRWYVIKSGGGTIDFQFGAAGDRPVPADYDGDGETDFAVFRPSTGQWWRRSSITFNTSVIQFGVSTDKCVPGDYTGDGLVDIAVWRPSNGNWFIMRSEDFSFYSVPFGTAGDIPTPGDYDGDGKSDTAIFRPSNSLWFIQGSNSGTSIQQFGTAGDFPTPNSFVP